MTKSAATKAILADADWWAKRAAFMNAKLHGFSGRYSAGFIMADGTMQEIGAALAVEIDRLFTQVRS